MNFETRSSGTVPWLVAVGLTLSGLASVQAQQIIQLSMHSKAILHEDGTRTESIKDVPKRELTETTFDARNVAIARKTFLLNENGDPLQGVIYDGAGNLIARVQFYFDSLGRLMEERCVNTRNEVFRRVIRQYDASGKAMPPQAFDYAVNAPNMKAATMNFTTVVPPPDAASTTQVPGQPQVMTVSPGTGRAAPRPEPEKKPEKKRGWFGFGKK